MSNFAGIVLFVGAPLFAAAMVLMEKGLTRGDKNAK